MMHNTMSQPTGMQECIDACKHCHDTCLRMALTHCLQMGGRHAEPEHMQLMIACAELCQTAANAMTAQVSVHGAICAACAEVCNACARSCEDIGDMDECVQACRDCGASCEEMSHSHTAGIRGQQALAGSRPQ